MFNAVFKRNIKDRNIHTYMHTYIHTHIDTYHLSHLLTITKQYKHTLRKTNDNITKLQHATSRWPWGVMCRLISEVACSNPAEGVDVGLLCLLCAVYVADSWTS
jgi:hypothetical protein